MFMQCHGDLVVAISGFISELIVGKEQPVSELMKIFIFQTKMSRLVVPASQLDNLLPFLVS